MAFEHHKWEKSGRKFYDSATGQYKYQGFIGQKHVDLGDGDFAPYVWDEPSQSIRYGDLQCEFDVDGFQVVREYGSIETLIDDQRFELQHFREQGKKWIVVDLFNIGLTVDQQDEQCIVTRNLSDDEGNTLDIDFLFKPCERVKLTFRLHVVDADQYRIRFQNSGIAGEVREAHHVDLDGTDFGVGKLLFDSIAFQWAKDEIDTHANYTIEDQAGGKKLDILIGDFDLPDNGDVVVSPDTFGPQNVGDAGMEYGGTWMDDSSGFITMGSYSSSDTDAAWTFTVTDTDLPGATIDSGTKIVLTSGTVNGTGCDNNLKICDSRDVGAWAQGNLPSSQAKHPDNHDWDEGGSGTYDSSDLGSTEDLVQARIDGDDAAGAHESGDKMSFVSENVASGTDNYVYWPEETADLTIVYTPAGGETYELEADVGLFTKGGKAAAILATRDVAAAVGLYSETGKASTITATRTFPAVTGAYTETGKAATITKGWLNLSADVGSYTETGLAAIIARGRTLESATGAYAETGKATTLLTTRQFEAAVGSYIESGKAAGIYRGRNLAAVTGSYSVTGKAVTFSNTYILAGTKGSFAESGKAVTFVKTYVLDAVTGVYVLAGLDATLTYGAIGSYELAAATGNFVESGKSISILRTATFSGATGLYTLSGKAAGVSVARNVPVVTGIYTVGGKNATLTYGTNAVFTAAQYAEIRRLIHKELIIHNAF